MNETDQIEAHELKQAEVDEEVIFDLSNKRDAGEFVKTLKEQIKKEGLPGSKHNVIEEIVELSAAGYSPSEMGGIKLPDGLDRGAIKGALSSEGVFVSTAAVELWLIRLKEAVTFEGEDSLPDGKVTEKKRKQLETVEKMATILFESNPIGREGLINDINSRQIEKNPDLRAYSDMNKRVLGELIVDKGVLTDEQIKHLRTSGGHVDSLVEAIRDVVTSEDVLLRIDSSLARAEQNYAVDTDGYYPYKKKRKENIGKLAKLNEEFKKIK